MEIQFFYPVEITCRNKTDFRSVFLDFPETFGVGSTRDQALGGARKLLVDVVSKRIRRNQPLPHPSHSQNRDHYWVVLPAQLSAKAALYIAMKTLKISKIALARRLNHDEKEVRRLLDPDHPSKLPRIESALAALGMRLVVEVRSS